MNDYSAALQRKREDLLSAGAVSYTPLPLPTICSV